MESQVNQQITRTEKQNVEISEIFEIPFTKQ